MQTAEQEAAARGCYQVLLDTHSFQAPAIIVSTAVPIDITPLLESAIRSELHMLELSLDRTAERLHAFEAQYDLTSEEFMRQFEAGALAESLDYIAWAGEIKTYQLLQTQQRALQSTHIQGTAVYA